MSKSQYCSALIQCHLRSRYRPGLDRFEPPPLPAKVDRGVVEPEKQTRENNRTAQTAGAVLMNRESAALSTTSSEQWKGNASQLTTRLIGVFAAETCLWFAHAPQTGEFLRVIEI